MQTNNDPKKTIWVLLVSIMAVNPVLGFLHVHSGLLFSDFPSIATPPKFNMEPENDAFQKESPFPGTSFQVPCWISGVYSKLEAQENPICLTTSLKSFRYDAAMTWLVVGWSKISSRHGGGTTCKNNHVAVAMAKLINTTKTLQKHTKTWNIQQNGASNCTCDSRALFTISTPPKWIVGIGENWPNWNARNIKHDSMTKSMIHTQSIPTSLLPTFSTKPGHQPGRSDCTGRELDGMFWLSDV